MPIELIRSPACEARKKRDLPAHSSITLERACIAIKRANKDSECSKERMQQGTRTMLALGNGRIRVQSK
jgi:hypothetical protein